MEKRIIHKYREFLKDSIRMEFDFSETDQNRGLPAPAVQKPPKEDQNIIELPAKGDWPSVSNIDLVKAIDNRQSRRNFKQTALKPDELSFLLWATQGIKEQLDDGHAFRTVPSAGCRHPFETYLAVMNVVSLDTGIYRYLPVQHALVLEKKPGDLPLEITSATLGQDFVGKSAVTFIWTAIPYRTEWRYGPAAHRTVAIDSGHVCQNLYLACEAIDAGTCGIAAYDQKKIDELIGVDGADEFTIYMAPVGKKQKNTFNKKYILIN
jgi:SagB-type dehydrogenase family enzyme